MPLGASQGCQPCAGRCTRCLVLQGVHHRIRGPSICVSSCLTPSCLLQGVHETGVFQNGQRVPTFRDRFGDSNNFQQSGSEEPWVRVAASCSLVHHQHASSLLKSVPTSCCNRPGCSHHVSTLLQKPLAQQGKTLQLVIR